MTATGSSSEYAHREKADGSFDSICLRCYRTASTATSEAALANGERTHFCSGDEPSHHPLNDRRQRSGSQGTDENRTPQ